MKTLEDGSLLAENWLDLHEELFSFPQFPDIGRHRSCFAYRGVDASEFHLETSLMRIKNTSMEPNLLRNFKKYTRSELTRDHNEWELLAVAQHYGLPTRLLDWSFSPYVALHFATSDMSRFKEDGAIWCLDVVEIRSLMPESYREKLVNNSSFVFTVDLLSEVSPTIKEFDSSKKSHGDFVVCLEPPSIDDRIINQYAMFTVMTNPDVRLDEWLHNHPYLYKKIIIPADLKLEIRDKLDQANVNERIIYPGLQGISAWLKRYYTNTELLKP